MSREGFSFTRGLLNAILTVVLFVVLPDLLITTLEQAVPGLSLGTNRILTATASGILVTIVAFCRGAFPKHSMIWALSGMGWSLFSAVYIYFLIGTPASYQLDVSGQPITIGFNISLLAFVIAFVMALNSLGNLIELSEARRKVTEKQRIKTTEIAA